MLDGMIFENIIMRDIMLDGMIAEYIIIER